MVCLTCYQNKARGKRVLKHYSDGVPDRVSVVVGVVDAVDDPVLVAVVVGVRHPCPPFLFICFSVIFLIREIKNSSFNNYLY